MRVSERRARKQRKHKEFMKRLAERDARNRGVVPVKQEEPKIEKEPEPAVVEVSEQPEIVEVKTGKENLFVTTAEYMAESEQAEEVVISTPDLVTVTVEENITESSWDTEEEKNDTEPVSSEDLEESVLKPKKRGKKKKS